MTSSATIWYHIRCIFVKHRVPTNTNVVFAEITKNIQVPEYNTDKYTSFESFDGAESLVEKILKGKL